MATSTKARLFYLNRTEDETGTSGTGKVAEGVVWEDGVVALRWLTTTSSVAIYASLQDIETIHGHGGKTQVVLYPLAVTP